MMGSNRITFRIFIALIPFSITVFMFLLAQSSQADISGSVPQADASLPVVSYEITGTVNTYLPLLRRGGTIVCGEITADTDWMLSGSPYRVTCDVIVPVNIKLTIEAGVIVQFQNVEDDVIISGTLQSTGTFTAPVRFQPMKGAQPGSWGRVAYMTGSSGMLSHTILEYGGSQDGLLFIASDAVQVLDSVVQCSADTGIYIQNASPLISASQILSNTGFEEGGGIYNLGGNPSIRNNMIISNTAFYGGGIYNNSGQPDINGNTFSGNQAIFDGGGLMNISASPNIQLNIFTNNQASNFGGALYNSGESDPTIQFNAFIKNNSRSNGGGIYTSRGSPLIWANTFFQNSASSGGGLFISSNSATVQNNIFYGNQAAYGGGLWLGDFIYTGGRVEFNTFFGNTGSARGGGMYLNSGAYSNPIIQSNLVFNNTAGEGGGFYVIGENPQLDYNDVWENLGGDYVNVIPGAHDISANPRLVDPANGDFHLTAGSPCINKANPSSYPLWDFEGDPRPNGPAPDIGADEYYP